MAEINTITGLRAKLQQERIGTITSGARIAINSFLGLQSNILQMAEGILSLDEGKLSEDGKPEDTENAKPNTNPGNKNPKKILKKITKIITKGTMKMVMEMEKNFQEIKGFRIKNRRKMEICQEKIIHQKIVLEKVLNIEKRLDKLKEITMFLRARSLLLVLI
jgi:hypothetical protein